MVAAAIRHTLMIVEVVARVVAQDRTVLRATVARCLTQRGNGILNLEPHFFKLGSIT